MLLKSSDAGLFFMTTFTQESLPLLCNKLAAKDKHLALLIKSFGYPPFWSRTASFATLIHIILEQQVSLASARAAFLKLQEKAGHITPQKILQLSDEQLKACYFSRQKTVYAKHLAQAIVNGSISLEALALLPDEQARFELKKIKGIGDWTVDVYLMMALHRCDLFPTGDIALLKSIKEVKGSNAFATKSEALLLAEHWRPYRTVAAFMLWHAYLSRRNIKP